MRPWTGVVDKTFPISNAEDMDALKERVLNERIRMLSAKLEVAIKQRDGFAKNYHEVCKVPYQERREIMEECDGEINSSCRLENSGQSD